MYLSGDCTYESGVTLSVGILMYFSSCVKSDRIHIILDPSDIHIILHPLILLIIFEDGSFSLNIWETWARFFYQHRHWNSGLIDLQNAQDVTFLPLYIWVASLGVWLSVARKVRKMFSAFTLNVLLFLHRTRRKAWMP